MKNQNYFNTLNEALDAEGLLEKVGMITQPVGYDQQLNMAVDGTFISVSRMNCGRYERAIHYQTQMEDFVRVQ